MKISEHTRRSFIKTAGLTAASALVPSFLHGAPSFIKRNRKPNILFLPVDDLRPQLNCYGHSQMVSPYLDRFASEGMRFNRSYCQIPVCGASRASLLTGVRPTIGRFIDYLTRVDEDLPGAVTIPKHFKDHGYHTLINGKVFHHLHDARYSWSEEPWYPALNNGNWRDYIRNENQSRTEANRGLGPPFENADVPDNAYADGKIADKVIGDLHRLKDSDKPFFLAAGFLKPHLPFNAPEKYWNMYKRENIDLADNPFRPKGAPDAALHNWGELRGYVDIPREGPLTDDMAKTLVHGYYASVSYTDTQIGKVLNELNRLGLRENTIVILWGDHGWNLGEHGLWCKHCNFETSLLSPIIISAPGISGDKQTDALTEYVDIFPSLCELSELPVPHHLEGTSFVPLLNDPNRPWKKAAFSRWIDGDSIRTDRYRYTDWTKRRRDRGLVREQDIFARMLYDHKNDPMENVNIADLPENKELVTQLRTMMHEGWRAARP